MIRQKNAIFNILFVFFNAYAIFSLFIPIGEGTIWYAIKYSNISYSTFSDIRAKAISTIIFIVIGAIFFVATIILLLVHKKYFFSALPVFFCIASVIKLSSFNVLIASAPYLFIADFLLIIFTIVALAIDIYRLVRHLKTRPPRPHKPTDKERIAELEKRVQELESKN